LFWSDKETYQVAPEIIEKIGKKDGMYTCVYRAKFSRPAKEIHLNILKNERHFYSFSLYIHCKDGSQYTIQEGELFHVYQSETVPQLTEIIIPTATQPRDMTLRFGITELNNDDRIAVFTFENLDGEIPRTEIKTWVPENTDPENVENLIGSFLIKEIEFKEVPGNVSKIGVSMFSPDKNGDSFIAGIILADLPCEKYESELLCSFTQGFYGNEGGKMCGKTGTPELLMELMKKGGDLIMGRPGNSFTILNDDKSANCIMDLLPGGGPSAVLSGDASCEKLGSIPLNKQGRIKNSLLAQGITLTLNTRLSDDLLAFPVDGTEFVTMMAVDCEDPEAGGIPGTEKVYAFSPELVDALPDAATIADLLDLVNDALGGVEIPLTLSQVSDAATLVNEAFDECAVVVDYAEIQPLDEASGEAENSEEVDEELAKQGGTKGVTGMSENQEGILGIYPNPALDYFNLRIPSSVQQVQHAAIYSLTGVKVMDIPQPIRSGVNQVIEINVSDLHKGIYFVRIQTAAGFVNERFGVQ